MTNTAEVSLAFRGVEFVQLVGAFIAPRFAVFIPLTFVISRSVRRAHGTVLVRVAARVAVGAAPARVVLARRVLLLHEDKITGIAVVSVKASAMPTAPPARPPHRYRHQMRKKGRWYRWEPGIIHVGGCRCSGCSSWMVARIARSPSPASSSSHRKFIRTQC